MRTEFDPGFVDGALLSHLQFDCYNYLMSGTHGVSLGAGRMPGIKEPAVRPAPWNWWALTRPADRPAL
jgi:hypothetical protein